MDLPAHFDSLMPAQIAAKAEDVGVAKGRLDAASLFLLAVLAGAFIALGAMFSTVSMIGTAEFIGYGLTRVIGGVTFCLGLILVVIAGAELFTGNNLMVMAAVSGKLPFRSLLRNWLLVYVGNFVGAVTTAYLIVLSGHYRLVAPLALDIAEAKATLPFVEAFLRGIYCNALVCLAVWLCMSCRTTTDKVVAILFPITAFVAAGFEHCVANMYLIPLGLFIKMHGPEVYTRVNEQLTWGGLAANLVPVTLGNIVGGAVMVGGVYWLIYCRHRPA